MISGFNTDVESEGRCFHVQSESHTRAFRSLESIVFCNGEVVGVVEHSFSNSSLKNAENPEEILERRLAKQHQQLVTVVRQGLVVAQETPSPQAECEAEVPPVQAVTRSAPRRILWGLALCMVGLLIGLVGYRLGRSASSPSVAAATQGPVVEVVAPPTAPDVEEARLPPVEPKPKSEPELVTPPLVASLPEPESEPEPIPLAPVQPAPLPPAVEEEVVDVAIEPVAQVQPVRPAPPAPVPPLEEPATPAVSRVVTPQEAPTYFKLAEGEYADLSVVELAPQANHRPLPRYTKKARRKREQGTVALDLLIDERGEVADVEIREAIVDSGLTDAAVETARGWRFSPARLNGKPIRVRKPVQLHFLVESGATRVRVTE